MGKVTYSPGIEYVQGALAKAKKKDGHRCGDYLIGTHRTAATQNPDCTRLYIRKGTSYERTNPLSSKELDARARFSAVATAVKVAFGNKIARVYTTPLNKRATYASALPKNRQISGDPIKWESVLRGAFFCPFVKF